MEYSPIKGNEAKIEAELEKRFATALAAALKENPKMTSEEKDALKETVSAELDGEIKKTTDCLPTMTEEEIRKRKMEIRKEIEAEIGISLSDEALILREVDMRFRAESLEVCMGKLTCAALSGPVMSPTKAK